MARHAGETGGEFSVVCAESRPGLEGRALAAALASDRVAVAVVADAAAAADLRAGDLVLVGADAVAADWFINKTGTRPLCAAATLAGVPAYVVAGREKFVPGPLARRLTLRAHDPADIWRDPGPGLVVTNALFERVPLDHVAAVLTDVGLLAGEMVRAAGEATSESAIRRLLDALAVA
jgi:translation initiation factor 2B subunit (eIF-2B alpha/beta/delta family)